MSKRKEEYQYGIQRITDFIEAFLREGKQPPDAEISTEMKSIEGFQGVGWQWHPLAEIPEEGATVLIEEQYARYDLVVPNAIVMRVIPTALADPETFQRQRFLYPEEG